MVHGEADTMKDDLNFKLYGLFSKLTTVTMGQNGEYGNALLALARQSLHRMLSKVLMFMATSAAVLNCG